MSGKTMVRYSDEELAEFKELIEGKIAEAKENLASYLEAYSNAGNDTMDTAPTFKEENGQLAARLEKYIKNLEAALIRIENKTYGICRVTGKLIPKERLKIVPHATLSYEAKMNQNK